MEPIKLNLNLVTKSDQLTKECVMENMNNNSGLNNSINMSELLKMKIATKVMDEGTMDPCKLMMVQKLSNGESLNINDIISMKLQSKLQESLLKDDEKELSIEQIMKFQIMQDLIAGKKIDISQLVMIKYLDKLV